MKEKKQEFKNAKESLLVVVHLFDRASTESKSFVSCSVSQPSTGIQSILYPFVGIGRKQRKKELEEHHSDPAVLPMAFKYLMYEHYTTLQWRLSSTHASLHVLHPSLAFRLRV